MINYRIVFTFEPKSSVQANARNSVLKPQL